MATTKVNTKFLLILVVVLGLAGTVLGGLYMMNVRQSAKLNVARGDKALAEGDLERAISYYGRAVKREPGNAEYLRKYEQAVLQQVPSTADEAAKFYRDWLGVLAHRVHFNPTVTEHHLALIRQLAANARQTNATGMWEQVTEAADRMLRETPADSPERVEARAYRALSQFRMFSIRTQDELIAAQRDVEQLIEEAPTSDLVWATALTGQMILTERMRGDGATQTILAEQTQKTADLVRRAMQAVPEGPETARLNLLWLIVNRSENLAAVSDGEVLDAAEHLISLLNAETSPALMNEAVSLLAVIPQHGLSMAINVLEDYLAANPDALNMRLMLARFRYRNDELDAAERTAQQVLDAPTLPTSFVSQLQFHLRASAAAVLVDVRYRRWEQASEDQREAILKTIEDARQTLAAHIADPVNDPLIVFTDGKIAFAKGDFNKASACFERLIREGRADDPELLMFSARSLERIGQFGLAHERLSAVVAMRPGIVPWVLAKARMEVQMGQDSRAAATLAGLPPEVQADPEVQQLRASIEARLRGEEVPEDDPVAAVIVQADTAMSRGEQDVARSLLIAALERNPDDLRLLQFLTHLEIRAGQRDQARMHLERAMAIAPDNELLRQMEFSLRYDDPIEATRAFLQVEIDDENERALAMLASMRNIAVEQQALAQALQADGQKELAEAARELAARAKAEAAAQAEKVERFAPESVVLLEHRFSEALEAKNWARAEELLTTAQSLNADQANGLLFKGRYEIVRGRFQDAVHTLERATERIGYSSAAWRALGYAYHSLNNMPLAQRAYEQAYRCNPRNVAVAKEYLVVLSRTGEQTRALQVLRALRKIVPNDWRVRESWLQLEAQMGNLVLVMRERRELHEQAVKSSAFTASDRVNAERLARLLAETRPSRSLLFDANGEPLYTDQRWMRMSAAEQERVLTQARNAWDQEINTILEQLARDGDSLQLAALRASIHRARNQIREGEQVLLEYIARHGESVEALIELGRYQAGNNHFSEAIATLRSAIAYQNPEQREADQVLGHLLLQLNEYAQAIEHLKKVQEVSPSREISYQIIEATTRLKRFDEADQLLADLLKDSQPDPTSALLEAAIAEGRADDLLAQGRVAEAEQMYTRQREMLAKAESLDPTSPRPRLLLAQSLMREYQRTRRATLLNDALTALQRADQIRAVPESALLRVAILKEQGQSSTAIIELERLLADHPDHRAARRELIQLHLASNNVTAALRAIDDAIKANPDVALWYEARGDVYRASDRADLNAALASYEKAYELAPTTPVLMKLVNTIFAMPSPDYRRAAAVLRDAPDLALIPHLREAYARVLVRMNRREEALEQARLAFQRRKELIAQGNVKPAEIIPWFSLLGELFPVQNPSQAASAITAGQEFALELCAHKPDSHELRALASRWLSAGASGVPKAIELQRQAIAMCSRDDRAELAVLHAELAEYHYHNGDFASAVTTYEQTLEYRPDDTRTLNNLAYIIAEQLNDPSRALTYAQRAATLKPDDATILDTLGWVHFRAGNTEQARQILEQSLSIEDTAVTNAHLAEVLLALNQVQDAAARLDAAEKLKPDPQTREKLQRLRDDIRKR